MSGKRTLLKGRNLRTKIVFWSSLKRISRKQLERHKRWLLVWFCCMHWEIFPKASPYQSMGRKFLQLLYTIKTGCVASMTYIQNGDVAHLVYSQEVQLFKGACHSLGYTFRMYIFCDYLQVCIPRQAWNDIPHSHIITHMRTTPHFLNTIGFFSPFILHWVYCELTIGSLWIVDLLRD